MKNFNEISTEDCTEVDRVEMNFEVDIEQFIIDLPNKIEQARRQLFSGNLNAVEFWHRRIADYINVLNVLCRRFEESQCDREFINSFNNLLAEIHSIYGRLEAVILTNADQYNDGVGVFRFPNNIPVEVTWGRPKLQITRVELERLFDIYKSWKEVASFLGVCERTIQRRRIELGMPTSSRSGPRSTYSNISEDNLCQVIREILNILPNAGESYVLGACRARGIHVQRRRLRDAINIVDPVSRALRRTVSIVRRRYNVRGPNSLW